MTETLLRTAFRTSREMEYFSEKELTLQVGQPRELWPLALTKELVDNALDAAETAGVPPEIEVAVQADAVSVADNGPGIPDRVIEDSTDYMLRSSDKTYYISPSRGQLGNALKCVYAAPFVAAGGGGAEIDTGGKAHTITVSPDPIAQRVEVTREVVPGVVRTGSRVTMRWPGIASYHDASVEPGFYNEASELVRGFAAFNPHAAFSVTTPKGSQRAPATNPAWAKWLPTDPTSPHWYTPNRLRDLIAAYLSEERRGGRARTVREFIAEFRGLSGTAKQKAVAEAAGLHGAALVDLVEDGDVSVGMVARLLDVMKGASKPVKPRALGVIGEDHMAGFLAARCGVAADSVRYAIRAGETDGVPFVLEAAFGVLEEPGEDPRARALAGLHFEPRAIRIVGVNWSPAIGNPIPELSALLGENRVDSFDPVVVAVHLAFPRPEFRDRGKGVLALPDGISRALSAAVAAVTKAWKAEKRHADRENRLQENQLERMRKRERARRWSIKDAAYEVMGAAYAKASASGTLPANARQVMYAARPEVLKLTGVRCWKDSSYFTQHLLPDFIEEHPDLTASWDVVFDARGHLREPHTGHEIPLGTVDVRRYVSEWGTGVVGDLLSPFAVFESRVETRGPANRYGHVLFVEKEGFNELLARARIAERFDVAIMSTKGMSVTAARRLAEEFGERGVAVLVLHDFDKAGFSILHTLSSDTRRYRFTHRPKVVDLGLRLDDVTEMGLESEPVHYEGKVDPRANLRESGATDEECEFLVRPRGYSGWTGQRVELNAMASDQLVAWLEAKLAEAGVEKVVPDDDALERAYRLSFRRAAFEGAVARKIAQINRLDIEVPADLRKRVRKRLREEPDGAWDDAVRGIAGEDRTRARKGGRR